MRVAIIGIGAIARLHARALAGIDGITLVAASCRTEEKGRAFAEEFNCVWYGDTSRMLRREKLDFVTVATPSGAHLDAVTAAARRGIHVICEKPLEISLKRIDRMLAATSKAGVTLGAISRSDSTPLCKPSMLLLVPDDLARLPWLSVLCRGGGTILIMEPAAGKARWPLMVAAA